MTQPSHSSTPRRRLPHDGQVTAGDDNWNRLQSMVLEVPGGEWTVTDGAKLSGLDPSVCQAILKAMADSGFLARRSNGTFVRASAAPRAQPAGTSEDPAQDVLANPGSVPLERIRREYLEMPALRLTERQAQRLCGMDATDVEPAIRILLAERFLCRTPDGAYAREKRKWPRPAPVKATLASGQRARQSA